MRNWGALRRELEALAAKGEDSAAFSVRSDRLEGDETDARYHAETRDLFGSPRATEKGSRTAPPAPVGHRRSQERELSERQEREEHERQEREEREKRERKEREERERKEREERERREREAHERKEREKRESKEREERERKAREESERRKKQDRKSRGPDRKTTATARSTRSNLKAGSSGGERVRTKKRPYGRRLPVWRIAAGLAAIALVGLVLLLRGLGNGRSSGGDPTASGSGLETVEETVEGAASADDKSEDTETPSNAAEPRPDPETETAGDAMSSEGESSISAVSDPDIRVAAEVRDDPECVGWNGMEYWRFATYERAKACFDAGADVQVRGADGGTPLHYVIQVGGELAVLELVLAAGADVNAPLADGSTPLHLAAEFTEQREVVALLVRSGADPNAPNADRFDFTPLHYAAQFSQHPEVIEALLDLGADPRAESSGGLTPWDLARDRQELLASEAFRRLALRGLRN